MKVISLARGGIDSVTLIRIEVDAEKLGAFSGVAGGYCAAQTG